MPMSQALKKAKKASSTALSQVLEPQRNIQLQSKNYSLIVVKAAELSSPLKVTIWNIFRVNMEGWYNSTEVFDWDPIAKRAELFHRDSRFFLVAPDGGELETDLVAYSMFRFDTEEDIEGKDQCVLYCYELQVAEACRGLGMGRWLVEMLENVAQEWRMTKIMLTVLKANVAATRFYQREGFETDDISPENEGYDVLSKAVQALPTDKSLGAGHA